MKLVHYFSIRLRRSIGCLPALNAAALSLAGNLETIWIHRRQNVNPRRIDQPRDVVIFLVVLEQELHFEICVIAWCFFFT